MLRLGGKAGERHLVRAEGALDRHAVHLPRPGPALGRTQHDHRPARPLAKAVLAGVGLDGVDLVERLVERRRHQPVHLRGLVAGNEVRLVPIAPQQLRQLLVRDAREHRGTGDLVAVQVQDRQHGAVALGVQELVGMPARSQRAGLGLAVADHAAGEQGGVVEHRAVGVQQRIAELAAFMDRARRFGCHMARNAARERELREEPLHAIGVLADGRVDLAVAALEIGVGDHARPAVPGAGNEDGVELAGRDGAVHVRIDEIQARGRAPVAQQPRLDVRKAQLLAQQRVVHQVDLAHGQVVGRAPPGVQQREVVALSHCSRIPRWSAG